MNYYHFLLLFFVIIIAGTELQYLMSCGCFAIIFYDLLCCCCYASHSNPFTFTIVLSLFHSGTMSWRNFYSFTFASINNFFRRINNNSVWQFTSQMHFMDSEKNYCILYLLCSRFACDSSSIVCPINFHRAKTFFFELVKIFFSSSTSILVVCSYFISWCEPQKH